MLLKYFNKDSGTLEDGVKVSQNSKTGNVYYVSLPCWGCKYSTCRCDAPCANGCYALNDANRFPRVKAMREYNYLLWKHNPQAFFGSVEMFCKTQSFFRWHESGDIIDMSYLDNIVKVARRTPNCKHLIFTKKYELVNEYFKCGEIPANLQIVLSSWLEWKPENPLNLPETDVLPVGETLPQGGLLCGGSCNYCTCVGVGCWQLQKNQTLYFVAHGAKKNQIKRGGSNA